MQVVTLDPAADPRWEALLERARASLFHSPAWARVLSDAYGFRVEALAALDDTGQPVAGIPFVRVSDFLGSRIVSLPFSDFAGAVAVSGEARRTVLASLLSVGLPLAVRCLGTGDGDEQFSVTKCARWHEIDVTPDLDVLETRMDSTRRRAIRKAGREGVVVESLDDASFLDAFAALNVGVRKRKYRLLAQPRTFFEAICRRFREVDGWHPLAAVQDGSVVAATLYLRWRDTLYYKFNASSPAALGARPNDLLVWDGIRLAKALGCRRLDFGASDDDQPGLIRFKEQFGAVAGEIRFLRGGTAGAGGAEEGAVKQARDVLSRLTALMTEPAVPDDATARAGELLYRFFA